MTKGQGKGPPDQRSERSPPRLRPCRA